MWVRDVLPHCFVHYPNVSSTFWIYFFSRRSVGVSFTQAGKKNQKQKNLHRDIYENVLSELETLLLPSLKTLSLFKELLHHKILSQLQFFYYDKAMTILKTWKKENKQKWLFGPTSYIVSENNQTSLTHANNVPNSRFEIAYFKSYISLRKLGCICMTNKVLCFKYGTLPKACFQYWNFRQNHWFFFGWKHVKFFSNRELGTFWEMSLTHKIHIFF